MSDEQSIDDLVSMEDDDFSDVESMSFEGTDEEETTEELDDSGSEEVIGEGAKLEEEHTQEEDSTDELEQKGESEEANEDDTEENTSDYEAMVTDLLTPFKANGKEMSVANVKEARHLMQKGANYDKKMATIKPNLRIIRMLDNNGLLDESKLNYLIDLDKKNPEAIAKLIKEAEIDPLDIDVSEDAKYQPSTYTVNDKEVELEEVLGEIRGTSAYTRTIDVVSNKWDDSSKTAITGDPSILKAINTHMSDGTFDKVMDKVDTERMFGRLEGLSDLEAYKAAGDLLYANTGNSNSAEATNGLNQKPSKKSDPMLANRKLAASGTRKKPPSNKSIDKSKMYNMSDDEIMAYMSKN